VGSFKIGGCQRHVVELLRVIDRDMYRPYICTMQPGGALLEEIEKLGLEMYCLDIGRILSLKTFIKIFKLAKFIRRNRIQIIHSYLFEANFLGLLTYILCFKWNLKLVASVRSIHESHTRRDFRINQVVNWFATKIIVVCDAVKQCVMDEGAPEIKIETIYNGVDCERYSPLPNVEDLSDKSNAQAHRKVRIGVVASLNEHKGHEYLIEALANMVKEYPNLECFFLGDGKLKTKLQSQARNLGIDQNIVFNGYQTNVLRYLRDADIFVLPSVHEGMSNALLEAMACRLPIVATDVGGNREVVSDGVSGYLVPPRDPRALAEKILPLVRDNKLRERFGNAGRKIAEADFSLKVMAKNYQEFYSRLLKQE
jgi:glycosyltransferase involved in cell wall biosynthesis